MRTIRVAIIGGGLAGLVTAYLLQKHSDSLGDKMDIDVSVYEEKDHFPYELENARVADTDYEMLSLVKELNVELIPELEKDTPQMVCTLMVLMITEILQLRNKQIIEKPIDWSQKDSDYLDALDAINIIEFFDKRGQDSKEVAELLKFSILNFYSDCFQKLSALDALRFVSQYLHCRLLYSLKNGNNTLLQLLIDSIDIDRQNVFLGKLVVHMQPMEGRWQLTFEKVKQEVFDYVVMANEYDQSNTHFCFPPGKRRLMVGQLAPNYGLFYAGRHACMDAPSTMGGAVRSAHRMVTRQLLPAIHVALPNTEEALMPTVLMAVFTSGNDAKLDSNK